MISIATYVVAAICIILSVVAYKVRAFNASGTVAAMITGLIIIFFDYKLFMILLLFVFLGVGSTKFRYSYKESLGVAEKNKGARDANNVFANGIISVLVVIFGFAKFPGEFVIAGYIGAISAATADTLASEVGVLAKEWPRLITKPSKKVPPGTNGAVTMLGTSAALIGTILIGVLAGIINNDIPLLKILIISIIAGMFGCIIDSVIGAIWEDKGHLTKNQVNIIATLTGALIAIAILLV
ncbi:MAG: DUF92 domain-containing protein [Euryarchaeota archaeon]|nr:DUF92 domain-containing protein [Euryarchaeota archaeon]